MDATDSNDNVYIMGAILLMVMERGSVTLVETLQYKKVLNARVKVASPDNSIYFLENLVVVK